ncbi:hypothetical protein VCHA37P203_30168 [Vibrio chagasii]|nr:hypothetical protein VCHA37P203_30168 [Vibrio chagasii]
MSLSVISERYYESLKEIDQLIEFSCREFWQGKRADDEKL